MANISQIVEEELLGGSDMNMTVAADIGSEEVTSTVASMESTTILSTAIDQISDPVMRMTEKEAAELFRQLSTNMKKLDPREFQHMYSSGDVYFYVLLSLCTVLMLAVVLLLYAFCCVYVMKGNMDLPGPHGMPQKTVKVWFKNPFKTMQAAKDPNRYVDNRLYGDQQPSGHSIGRRHSSVTTRESRHGTDDSANFMAAQRRYQSANQQLHQGDTAGPSEEAGAAGSATNSSSSAVTRGTISFNTAFAEGLRKQLSRDGGSDSPQYISLNEEF